MHSAIVKARKPEVSEKKGLPVIHPATVVGCC
jgi:hypothetical protein